MPQWLRYIVFISIHAPLAGSDQEHSSIAYGAVRFQSTLPLRGATPAAAGNTSTVINFNPRSPCGERPKPALEVGFAENISIHAPLAGSDPPLAGRTSDQTDFNPRSPCGERPAPCYRARNHPSYFNPRSPCGERPKHPTVTRSR